MKNRDRYTRGAHTVLELQYHFVWKTKYSYPVLRGDIALCLRELVKEICDLQGIRIVRGNIRVHIHVLVMPLATYLPQRLHSI